MTLLKPDDKFSDIHRPASGKFAVVSRESRTAVERCLRFVRTTEERESFKSESQEGDQSCWLSYRNPRTSFHSHQGVLLKVNNNAVVAQKMKQTNKQTKERKKETKNKTKIQIDWLTDWLTDWQTERSIGRQRERERERESVREGRREGGREGERERGGREGEMDAYGCSLILSWSSSIDNSLYIL